MTTDPRTPTEEDDLLDSWKEIADFLRRTVRTAQTWEKNEGLPVHRHAHQKSQTVFAYKSEIEAWLEGRVESATVAVSRERRWPAYLGRALAGGAIVLVAMLAGIMWTAKGSPKPAPDADPLRALIVDFENHSGDPRLDGALEFALQRELAGAPELDAVPIERVLDTLRLMERPLDTPIDEQIGREICLRDGDIPILIRGRVDRMDSTYSVGLQLIEAASGQVEVALAEDSVPEGQMLAAIGRLARRARIAASEVASTASLVETPPRVTTESLKALQLYALANRTLLENNLLRDYTATREGLAERLLREAIIEDPDFASAHVLLAWSIRRQEGDADEMLRHIDRAVALANGASEIERLFIRASQASMRGEHAAAASLYEAVASIDPTHYWALNNLAVEYGSLGRYADGSQAFVRLADALPNNLRYQARAVGSGASFGIEFAGPYYERARRLAGGTQPERLAPATGANLQFFPIWDAWSRGDVQRTGRLLDTLRTRIDSLADGQRQRERLAWQGWRMSAALGRPDGESWSALVSHPQIRAQIALEAGDEARFRATFADLLENDEYVFPFVLIGAVRLGLAPQVSRIVEADRTYAPSVMPFLELERGHVDEALGLLERLFRDPPGGYGEVYFDAVAALARIHRNRGDLAAAVRVREAASEKRSEAAMGNAAPHWIRNQRDLSELYRSMNRPEEAAQIDEELARLLGLGDAGRP